MQKIGSKTISLVNLQATRANIYLAFDLSFGSSLRKL